MTEDHDRLVVLEERLGALEAEVAHRRALVNGYIPGQEIRDRLGRLEGYVSEQRGGTARAGELASRFVAWAGLALAAVTFFLAVIR